MFNATCYIQIFPLCHRHFTNAYTSTVDTGHGKTVLVLPDDSRWSRSQHLLTDLYAAGDERPKQIDVNSVEIRREEKVVMCPRLREAIKDQLTDHRVWHVSASKPCLNRV
jgi:hypothetical protein